MFLGADELNVCHCKCVHDDCPIILPSRVIGPYFTVTTTLADVLHTHLIIDANTHQTSDLMSGMTTLLPDYRHISL